MILVSRNDPESHAMLRQVLGCGRESLSIKRVFFNRIYIADCPGDEHLILCDDPFALLYAFCFTSNKYTHLRLWALEIWEHQVPLRGAKSILRYIAFFLASWQSYLVCDSVLFPSETRRSFLCKKYRILNLRRKSKLVLNIPEFFRGEFCIDTALKKKFDKFRSEYKTLLIYAGSLQEGRLLDELVRGKKAGDDVGLVICGSGPMKSALLEVEAINSDILFMGNLNQSALSYVYDHSDAGVLTYDNKLLNTRMCAPLKLWEYIFHNLFIVGNRNDALMGEWQNFIDGFYSNESDIYQIINSDLQRKTPKIIPKFDYLAVTLIGF